MSCVCWIMSKYEPHSGKLHAFICVLEHNGPATTLKNRAVRLELTRYYRHYQIYNVPVRRHKHALNIAHDKIQQYFKVVLRTIGTPKISLLPGADHASSGHSRELSKGRVESWQSQPSLIKPCVQFSRTRLSDILHTQACAFFQPAVIGTS